LPRGAAGVRGVGVILAVASSTERRGAWPVAKGGKEGERWKGRRASSLGGGGGEGVVVPNGVGHGVGGTGEATCRVGDALEGNALDAGIGFLTIKSAATHARSNLPVRRSRAGCRKEANNQAAEHSEERPARSHGVDALRHSSYKGRRRLCATTPT